MTKRLNLFKTFGFDKIFKLNSYVFISKSYTVDSVIATISITIVALATAVVILYNIKVIYHQICPHDAFKRKNFYIL